MRLVVASLLVGLGVYSHVVLKKRNRAEEALRESEERYRRLVDLSPEAMYVTVDGKFAYVNQASLELYRASSAEDFLGRDELDFVHPDDREMVADRVRRVSQGESLRFREGRILGLDGEVRDVSGSGVTIVYSGQQATQVVLRNITERKQAKRELQRLALVVSNIGEGVVVTDPEGRIAFANRGLQRLLGYEPGELEGKPVSDLYPGGGDSPVLREIMDGLPAGGWSGEAELQAKNGKRVPTLETASPISDAAGRMTGYVCTNTDISERKRAEEQLKAALGEKEVLLKEINHRVQNNLQLVSSLLGLQAMETEDDRALEGFRASQNRVRTMAIFHQELYQSKDLSMIDFGDYIGSVATSLFEVYQLNPDTITPIIEVESVALGVDAAIPCGLIMNELVSNALTHGFPPGRSGEIRVALRSIGDS